MKPVAFLTPIIMLTVFGGKLLANPTEPSRGVAVVAGKDIVTIASEADDFSTLVAAIKAAGLAETLSGNGEFTVFAPSNAAFGALPEGLMVRLMEPEQKEKLAEILKYHVLPGKIMAANIAPEKVATLGGKEAIFTVEGPVVTINGAKITAPDIEASNGVIHVIDKVLIPPVVIVDDE